MNRVMVLAGQKFFYERCDCCPDHWWWRPKGAARVCRECWHVGMPMVSLAQALIWESSYHDSTGTPPLYTDGTPGVPS